MTEMHRAAPGAIRRVVVHMAIATVAGVFLIVLLQMARPALLEWATAEPALVRWRAQTLIALLGAVVVLPVIGAAAYLWRLGGRIVRGDRFPPEGFGVIRDVPVVRGHAARSKGRLFQTIGVVFAAMAVFLALALWRLATLPPAV